MRRMLCAIVNETCDLMLATGIVVKELGQITVFACNENIYTFCADRVIDSLLMLSEVCKV
jgi:hypothetical protein